MEISKTIVLENASSRIELGSNGYPQSLIDKQAGKDYLVKDPLIPMMQLSTVSASSEITRCSFVNGEFRAEFGATGVTAVFKVAIHPDYFHWKLVELVNGETVTSIQVFHVFVEIREHRGDILNIAWNDQFAFCALGISNWVRAELVINLNTGPTLSIYRETGLIGSEWAIIACPRNKVETVIGEIADAHGLPNPKVNGVRAKDVPFLQRSYFLAEMTEANHEIFLDACLSAGIRLIQPNYWPLFYGNVGHYTLRHDTYPGGEAGYGAIVKKFQKAGIGVGMHVLLPEVNHTDSYASPQLHPDLVRANAFVLAKDLDEKSSVIVTERPPVGMLGGGSLLIEDERIEFGWVSWNKPYGFQGVQRGCYNTLPVRHKAGTIVYLIGTVYGAIQLNMHSDLLVEISRNVARWVNRFGLDLIFFDGNEGPVKIAQSRVPTLWYDRLGSVETVWSMLDRQNIIIQSSDIQHRHWHLITAGGCGDPDPKQPPGGDVYVKRSTSNCNPYAPGYENYVSNLIPPMLDALIHGRGPGMRGLWDGVSPTTVRDIEVYLNVAREFNCQMVFEITEEDLKTNQDLTKIFKLIKEFETERLKC